METEIIINDMDQTTLERLKFEANRQGIDIKVLVIQMIKKSLGIDVAKIQKSNSNDLLKLAGTWTEEEFKEFENNTSGFSQIDEELWK